MGFSPLSAADVRDIVCDVVPDEFLVSSREAVTALQSIKTKKAPGPDGVPNVILNEFAFELGPVIIEIYNASLREGTIPPLLKQACVRPLPKQNPASSVENDVRPVSLTSQIAKVMEGFTLVRMLPTIIDKLDVKQFAVSGTRYGISAPCGARSPRPR